MNGDQSPESPIDLNDREQAGLMDPIDHERCRYPYCIVWTPIPVLTWVNCIPTERKLLQQQWTLFSW